MRIFGAEGEDGMSRHLPFPRERLELHSRVHRCQEQWMDDYAGEDEAGTAREEL